MKYRVPRVPVFLAKWVRNYSVLLKSPDRAFDVDFLEIVPGTKYCPGDVNYTVKNCHPRDFQGVQQVPGG